MRFDWYQATAAERVSASAVEVLAVHSDDHPEAIKGAHGYSRGWAMRREGRTFARVYQGHGLPEHVVASGEDAPAVADLLRGHLPHQVSRADVCVDYEGGDATFAQVRAMAESVALGRVVITDYVERAPAGTAATCYVGARSSEVRARIYEKGKQDPRYPVGTVRAEVQTRPSSRDRKQLAATLDPAAFWGLSRWSRQLMAELGVMVPAAPVRTPRVSDLDGALNAMSSQYGRRLLELAERLEGDVEAFALDLLARVYGSHPSQLVLE